jgi:hypothetical protein
VTIWTKSPSSPDTYTAMHVPTIATALQLRGSALGELGVGVVVGIVIIRPSAGGVLG